MLHEEKYAVTVFVADSSNTGFNIETNDGIRIIRFNPAQENSPESLGHAARLSHAFSACVRRFILAEGQPDCIEVQDYLGIGYYLTQYKHCGYAELKEVPIIITLHSPAFLYLEYNRAPVYQLPDYWTGEMEKQAIAAADLLIAPSAFLADCLRKRIPMDEKEIVVIPNPYQTSSKPSPGFERNRIVYYGKLSAQKGSFVLLETMKTLWDEGYTWPLHIIGGTDILYHPEQRTMGSIVHQQYGAYIRSGLLTIHAKVKPAAIPAALQQAHVVVLPSLVDNLPYVVTEAMSLGKVLLVSAQGGQAEMVEDGVTGFVFDHLQPNAFLEKLKYVLDLPGQTITEIGMAAAERAKAIFNYRAVGRMKTAAVSNLINAQQASNRFPFLYQENQTACKEKPFRAGRLSVVIPFYNLGEYLPAAVASITGNQWPDTEIIIIDDGSTEEGVAVLLNALSDSRPNIRLLRRKNKGLAYTRNEGASIATGEFLAFLDADDRVLPGYYPKAIALMQARENVFFVGCWVQYFGDTDKQWITSTPQPPLALLHNSINSSSLVYRRDAFLTGGLNDKNTDYGLEDYESVVNMLANGFNGVVLPEILFQYQVRQQSMFRKLTVPKQLYAYVQISQKHRNYFSKYAIDIINLLNANGPGYLFDNFSVATDFVAGTGYVKKLEQQLKQFIRKKPALKKIALRILNRVNR
jgi:glycosyltransferase involved in cell wall biosynthesis